MLENLQANICFIGMNNYVLAFIDCLYKKGIPKEKISFFENINILQQERDYLKKADIVILLLAPEELKNTLVPLKKYLKGKVIVSMIAGVGLSTLANVSGCKRVIRVISNPPVLTHIGTHVLIASEEMDQFNKDLIEMIFLATSQTFWAPSETQADAIIAISGSGPAYFFYILDSMIKTAISLGLDKQFALDLALQAANGAVEMVRKTKVSPGDLCGKVTLANGVTASALRVFDLGNVSDDIGLAMKAAYYRSKEITIEITNEVG